MKISKIFTITNGSEEFNNFVINHPPVGTDGLKLQTNYIFLQYDDGTSFSKEHKISHLLAELNTLSLQEIEEERQYRDAIKMRDSFDYASDTKKWKEIDSGLIPFKKVLELTVIKMDVIVEMLKELGKDLEVSHNNIPTPSPEPENIKSPFVPKKK